MQGENEGRWKKKKKKNAHDISSKRHVTKKFLEVSRCSTVTRRNKTRPRIYKPFPESKNTSQNPKILPGFKNTSQWSKHALDSASILDSWMCFWFLGRVLDSWMCFWILDVFWILGSVSSLYMKDPRYCSRTKQRQRNVQKKWAARAKFYFFFANQTYCCFFTVLVAFTA